MSLKLKINLKKKEILYKFNEFLILHKICTCMQINKLKRFTFQFGAMLFHLYIYIMRNKMYCKPTFIHDDIILQFTGHKLVSKDKFLRVRLIKLCVV